MKIARVGKDIVRLRILEIAANRNQYFKLQNLKPDISKNHKFLLYKISSAVLQSTPFLHHPSKFSSIRDEEIYIRVLIDTIEELGSSDRKIRIAGLFNGIHFSEDIYSGY